MAVTSGTVNTNTYSKSNFYVNWQQSSQSTSDNSTTINWQAGLYTGTSSSHDIWGNNAIKIYSVYINGSLVSSGGTWGNISSGGSHELLSGSFTIGHNSDGTKSFSISISAWLYSNHNLSGSGDFELTTIPRYFSSSPTLSLIEINETNATFYWTTSEYCDQVQYNINGGSWINVGGTGTSGTYTITGLTPNTQYTIYGDYKRADSQLWSTSGGYNVSTSIKTYDYPKPTSINDFVIGNGATVYLYNPLGRNCTLQLISNNDGSVLGTYNGTYQGYVNSEFKTQSAINSQYASIPNSKSGTYYAKVTYGGSVKTLGTGTYSIDNSDGKCNPIFDTSNWSYVSDLISLTNDNQKVVNNQSTITFSIDTEATPKLSSTIKEYQYKWGNKTNIQGSSDVVRGNGSQLEVIAIDTRGYSTSSTLDLGDNFVDYKSIINSSSSTHREDGVEADTTLNLSGTFFNNTFGEDGVQNEIISANYYVSQTTDFSQSTAFPINISDFTINNNYYTLSDYQIHEDGTSGGFTVGTRFYVKVEITDKLSTTTISNITVTDGKLAFDVYQDNNSDYHVGINGLADPNYALKVYGSISNATSTTSGGIKIYMDSSNNLYITNDGSSPIPSS